MKRRHAQTFLVIPSRKAVGLTSVALGLVRALQRLGVEAGFVKPIAEETPDRSGYFARQIFQMAVPEALLLQETAERIAANQTSELLEEIVGLCMRAGADASVLVIEGLHADESHSFISQVNVDIARSLNAEVIVVADASQESAFGDLRLAIGQFLNAGCKVAGVVFNQAAEDFDGAAAQRRLGKTRLWGVVHDNPILRAPRTLDVAQHLNAEVVMPGEIGVRRVIHTAIAARSVAQFIPGLQPGKLVISSGDRDDIILAVALAASRGIELAGLLLTHGSKISPQVMELAAPAFNTGLPVLRTADDSFTIARRIGQISSAVPSDDMARMNGVLDTVAEHLDTAAITASFLLPEKRQAVAAGLPLSAHPEGAGGAQAHRSAGRRRAAHRACREHLRAEGYCPLRPAWQARGHRNRCRVARNHAAGRPRNTRPRLDPPALRRTDGRAAQAKGLTMQQAVAQLEDAVVLGTMMLAVDDVDGLVSGAVHTTASTVRPALQLIKTAPGSSIVSSVFFMLMPEQVLVYGDCAINPAPTAEQLAEIAKQSADSATAFASSRKWR